MSSIAAPIGILLSGPLAELIGIKYLFISSGILGIIVVGITYTFGSLRKLDLIELEEEDAEEKKEI